MVSRQSIHHHPLQLLHPTTPPPVSLPPASPASPRRPPQVRPPPRRRPPRHQAPLPLRRPPPLPRCLPPPPLHHPPRPFLFSTLISAVTCCRLFSAALFLIPRMLSLGLTPDPFILPTVFKACAGVPSLPYGRQLHSLSLVTGHSSDPFVQSSLVRMYLKCGSMLDAHRVFDRMAQRSVVSWSALIAGYASRGNVVEAMKLFGLMRGSGVEPNSVTWNGLIAGFSHTGHSHKSATLFQRMHAECFIPDGPSVSSTLPVVGDIEDVAFGWQIHGYVIKAGMGSDTCVVSALIDMYGKCRRTEEMVRIFDEVSGMEVGSCNALVAVLSRNGLVDDALQAFREFRDQGIDLNVVSGPRSLLVARRMGRTWKH